MQIRCPQCQFDREIDASKIPSTAVMATCPRCKARFRFRTLTEITDETDESGFSGAEPSRGDTHASQSAQGQSAHGQSAHGQSAHGQSAQGQTPPPLGKPGDDPLPPGAVVPSFKPVAPENAPENAPEDAPEDAPEGTPEKASENKGTGPSGNDSPTPTQGSQQAPNNAPQSRNGARDANKGTLENRSSENRSSEHRSSEHRSSENKMHDFTPFQAEKSFADRVREAAAKAFKTGDISPGKNAPEKKARGENPFEKNIPEKSSTGESGRSIEFISGDMAEVPWEMPNKYSPLVGLYQTILRVMFGAPRFFSALSGCTGPLARPIFFYIILGVFQTIVKLMWYQTVGPSITDPQVQELLTSTARDMSVPMTLILAPGLLALQLLFYSGLFYLMLRLVEPDKAVFATVLRVVAYSSAPLVVCAVPVIGPFVGLIWFALNCFMGCKYALNTAWYKVALALVPLYLIAFAIVMQLMEHLLSQA